MGKNNFKACSILIPVSSEDKPFHVACSSYGYGPKQSSKWITFVLYCTSSTRGTSINSSLCAFHFFTKHSPFLKLWKKPHRGAVLPYLSVALWKDYTLGNCSYNSSYNHCLTCSTRNVYRAVSFWFPWTCRQSPSTSCRCRIPCRTARREKTPWRRSRTVSSRCPGPWSTLPGKWKNDCSAGEYVVSRITERRSHWRVVHRLFDGKNISRLFSRVNGFERARVYRCRAQTSRERCHNISNSKRNVTDYKYYYYSYYHKLQQPRRCTIYDENTNTDDQMSSLSLITNIWLGHTHWNSRTSVPNGKIIVCS